MPALAAQADSRHTVMTPGVYLLTYGARGDCAIRVPSLAGDCQSVYYELLYINYYRHPRQGKKPGVAPRVQIEG